MNSPYTNWTRQTWEDLADTTLAAVRPHASPTHALINLPGPPSRSGHWSDGLEGFARTFLLAAFRLAQSDETNLAEWYAEGLKAGTDPTSPERWPTFAECTQAKVEGASIAIALHETRPHIWDRLDDATRQNIVAWMGNIIGDPIWDNNWTWFQAIMEAFLRSVGGPSLAEDIERTLARTEAWYVGNGWYSDGTRESGALRNFDYYCGWAMHFYPLWYCRMSDSPPDLLTKYRARLTDFLGDVQHLIAANGAPLLQGRSLTYRFAMLAPFWTGAIFDATPLTPGATRRLASGVVRHFVTQGCFDEDGLLPLGWYRSFPNLRQLYSGPGSPYWASKAFAGLVLPKDHPVWTDTEEPMPIEQHDVQVALPAPGWLVSGTTADGIVRIAAHGPDHATPNDPTFDAPEYARHAYSTHTAFDIETTNPVDSHIALLTPDGCPSHRRPVHPLHIDGRTAISRSQAHWPAGQDWTIGPWLTTASVLRGPWEVRLARVDEPGPWRLRIGGWPIAADQPPTTDTHGSTATARRPDGLTSTVSGHHGLTQAGHEMATDRNALGRHSTTPWVATENTITPGQIYTALVTLSGVELTGEVRIDTGAGGQVTITWPDGEVDRLEPGWWQ